MKPIITTIVTMSLTSSAGAADYVCRSDRSPKQTYYVTVDPATAYLKASRAASGATVAGALDGLATRLSQPAEGRTFYSLDFVGRLPAGRYALTDFQLTIGADGVTGRTGATDLTCEMLVD